MPVPVLDYPLIVLEVEAGEDHQFASRTKGHIAG